MLLGPGILFASTAIGVSHLVQSTRAGADYGWGLVGAIVLANVAKYPFFEFGSRYAAATGTSLIDGFRKMGRPVAWAYLLVTLCTCFFVMGAIGLVTASFLDNLTGISAAVGQPATIAVAAGMFMGATAMLVAGKFGVLDGVIKAITAVLFVSTIAAFAVVWWRTPLSAVPAPPADFAPWRGADLAFAIALMGWMPTAVDLSTWNSLWTLERIRQTKYKPPLRHTLAEFNVGYLFSAVLALMFCALGAWLMYLPGRDFPVAPAAFAAAVVQIYTEAVGDWSFWLMAAAAFSAMIGTCIACLDGYARSLSHSVASLRGTAVSEGHMRGALVLIAAGAFWLIWQFGSDIRTLVDFATTMSFVIAPVVGLANLMLVTRADFPAEARPPRWLIVLAWAGLVVLTALGVALVLAG
jgi:Mn2+/Fe2+ NRAMP family transporter